MPRTGGAIQRSPDDYASRPSYVPPSIAFDPAAQVLVIQLLATLGLPAAAAPAQSPPVRALLEVDAVASWLGVTRWTIYRWAKSNRIPCVRAGRKVRFELKAVVDALRCGITECNRELIKARSRAADPTIRLTPERTTAIGRALGNKGVRRVTAPRQAPSTKSARTDDERRLAAIAATRGLSR